MTENNLPPALAALKQPCLGPGRPNCACPGCNHNIAIVATLRAVAEWLDARPDMDSDTVWREVREWADAIEGRAP